MPSPADLLGTRLGEAVLAEAEPALLDEINGLGDGAVAALAGAGEPAARLAGDRTGRRGTRPFGWDQRGAARFSAAGP